MALALSSDEANARIAQIDELLGNLQHHLSNAHQTQLDMVGGGGPWTGQAANTYRNSADEQHEHFTAMQQNLNHIVETGSNHMLSVATADGN